MDWNGNLRPPFLPLTDHNPLSFLYNHNFDHYPDWQTKNSLAIAMSSKLLSYNLETNFQQAEMRKKRMTTEQLETLERSFTEEIKLEPERKMKLARELGLQPRQVAVWFQNRRARWKAKQLEQLYGSLKHEFDLVSRENQRLQDEVLALKAMLKDQSTKNQVSTGCTKISGGETAESTSVGNRRNCKQLEGTSCEPHIAEANYVFNVADDYNPPEVSPYWGTILPSYP
ncbi:hypothetical protein NMG60_11008361 [Bertholletia excelsa]